FAVARAVDGVRALREVRNPILERLPDAVVRIELVVLRQAVPAQVLVHAAEVAPVVGEHEHQRQAPCARFVQDPVEALEAIRPVIVGWAARHRVPVLEVDALLVPWFADVWYGAIERAAIE